MEMVYSLPPAIKEAGLSTVALQLPFESAVTVWEATSSAQDRRKGECLLKLSSFPTILMPSLSAAFTQTLCEHVHRHFSIKLSVSRL